MPDTALAPSITLASCEARIVQSQREFQSALYDIWQYALWRESGAVDFADYLRQRWQYKPRYVRYLRAKMNAIDGVRAALADLNTVEVQIVDGTPVPDVVPTIIDAPEGVTRPLASLMSNPQKAAAWVKAVETAGGNMPTEAQVKAAVTVVQRDARDEADALMVSQHANVYPFVLRLPVRDAAALVTLLNGIPRRVRDLAVKAQITEQTLIRELERISGSDSFDEIEATRLLQWSDGSTTPITHLNAATLRSWLDERKRAHIQIAYDAATATYSLPMQYAGCDPVVDETTGEVTHRALTWYVPAGANLDAMLVRLVEGGRYDVQIRVVERTK